MITLHNISKTYNPGKSNECKALKNVSLTIDNGELLGIIGRSGSGKSTLLHIIGCIDNSTEGEYYLDDIMMNRLSQNKCAKYRNEKIGIVMQDFALVEEYTALENVMIPLSFARPRKRHKKATALSALKSVDMDAMANKPVKNLSGGQKQRVAIARAIVNNPDLILADEPTGALDSKTSAEIMDLFVELNKNGKTIIIITHNAEIANRCKRVISIDDGRIEAIGN